VAEAENGRRAWPVPLTARPTSLLRYYDAGTGWFRRPATIAGKPRTALIPFIFLTALAANPDRQRGMAEGADDYITKRIVLTS